MNSLNTRGLPRIMRASVSGAVYVGRPNAGRRFLVLDVEDQDVKALLVRLNRGVPRDG